MHLISKFSAFVEFLKQSLLLIREQNMMAVFSLNNSWHFSFWHEKCCIHTSNFEKNSNIFVDMWKMLELFENKTTKLNLCKNVFFSGRMSLSEISIFLNVCLLLQTSVLKWNPNFYPAWKERLRDCARLGKKCSDNASSMCKKLKCTIKTRKKSVILCCFPVKISISLLLQQPPFSIKCMKKHILVEKINLSSTKRCIQSLQCLSYYQCISDEQNLF